LERKIINAVSKLLRFLVQKQSNAQTVLI
jgi:hypothetical protein